MNPPGTIGGNFPQGTNTKGFNISYSLRWVSDFSNRRDSWRVAAISANHIINRLFKNSGHENIFEVEKGGHENSKFQLQLNHTD